MKVFKGNNYPKIPHFSISQLGSGDIHIDTRRENQITETVGKKKYTIFVSHKYDGTNVGIMRKGRDLVTVQRHGYTAVSSKYEMHQQFDQWVQRNKSFFLSKLKDGDRLVGEWLLVVHGLRYFIPSGIPFVALDIYDSQGKAHSWEYTLPLFEGTGIQTPQIYIRESGVVPLHRAIKEQNRRFDEDSKFRGVDIHPFEAPEGLVYRMEHQGSFKFAAKYVRSDFEAGLYLESPTPLYNILPCDIGDL